MVWSIVESAGINGTVLTSSDGEGETNEPASGSFWSWFQHAEKFTSESAPFVCPEAPHQQLCETVYKFLKRHKARRVFDASCPLNTEWLPLVVKRMQEEFWGFKLYCSNHEGPVTGVVRAKFDGIPAVEFVSIQWWIENFQIGRAHV